MFKPNFIEAFGEEAGTEKFQEIKHLSQETAVMVTGVIKEDSRSKFGYEMDITDLEVVGASEDYPITPKEHGTDFLMDHRHLWLRSSKQHAIMLVRNEIIRATYEFFNEQGFIKIDSPILTGSAPEGTTELFETDYWTTSILITNRSIICRSWCDGIWKSLYFWTNFPCGKIQNSSSLNGILDD